MDCTQDNMCTFQNAWNDDIVMLQNANDSILNPNLQQQFLCRDTNENNDKSDNTYPLDCNTAIIELESVIPFPNH